VQAPSQGGGEPCQNLLAGDLSLFDLRDPPLGDAHSVRYLLLGKASTAPRLGKPLPHHGGEQLLLASLNRFLAAGSRNVLGPGDNSDLVEG
jgi:hypothetical protein